MRRHRKSMWTNKAAGICVSAAAGLGIMVIITAFFSVITYFLIGSMDFADIFSLLSAAAGGFYGAYICGKYRRRKGLAEGALCGFVIYMVLCLAGILVGTGAAGIKKLLLLTLSGAAGGVNGVNSKRPPKLMD